MSIMTPEAMAELHAKCFTTTPRPWKAHEFRDLTTTTGSFVLTRDHGFLVGRVIADEAELLTLAVDPIRRREGIGMSLTREFLAYAQSEGAISAYLEVAEKNHGAYALYTAAGWQEKGTRRDYYGASAHAVLMGISLAE